GSEVPHGWTGEQTKRYVEQVLARKFLNGAGDSAKSQPLGDVLREPVDRWRLPQHPPQNTRQSQTVGEYLTSEFQVAEKRLQLQCNECHLMSADSAIPLQVKPVAIHPVWFANAKFSHFTHQAVNCQACHAEAYPQELPAEPSAVQTLD